MASLRAFLARLRALLISGRLDQQFGEELQAHLDMLVDDYVRAGVTPREARRRARLALGGIEQTKEAVRDARATWLDSLGRDVRFAVRMLVRNPGFTLTCVLTLALGIGVNVAVFSIVDATLLKPLPFRDSDRLVDIVEVQRKGTAEETHSIGMTRTRLHDWRTQRQLFDAIEAYGGARPVKLADGETTVLASQIAPGLFPLLGLSPSLGRNFLAGEPLEQGSVLISDGLWKRLFGSDRGVVGRSLQIDGRARTIIGVMPPRTRFPLGGRVDAWFPLSDVVDPQDPGSAFVSVVARFRRGLTPATAQTDLDRAAAAIQKARPSRYRWGAEVLSIDPRKWLHAGSRPIVLVAFGAVAFVLLAACANVASILLGRTSDRQRELSVRAALGATRARIAAQLLVESGLLSIAGGAIGVLLARWLVRVVPPIIPPRLIYFPVHDVQLDWRVLTFALGASLLVGLLSGLLPALRGSREGVARLLSTLAPMAVRTRSHRRARNALIAVQATLAVVLLTGAGLMGASFVQMVASDPGYDADRLLAVGVALPANRYSTLPEQAAFFEQLLGSIRTIPGVAGVTSGYSPANHTWGGFVPEGQERDATNRASAALLSAGVDYFRVLGIRIVAGRGFSSEDRANTLPVAIIDEDAARRFWPGQTPLGKRFRYSPYVRWITVVGVARNIKTSAVGEGFDALEVYLPESQQSKLRATTLLLRVSGDGVPILLAVRARIHTLEPKAQIRVDGPIEEMYARQLTSPRFAALMMSLFAALALVTAAVGLYGVLSYGVTQRTSEIGVRVALGATRRDVMRLVVGDALWPVLSGLALGMLAAQWLTRFIASQLYHLSPHDPVTIALVLAFFIAVALAAAYVPARRATRVDPIAALRAE